MKVPFQDLPLQTSQLRSELDVSINSVLSHCGFIQGPELAMFESNFASFCGTKHAIGVSSGTDAIELALRALGISAGDEVITAANSFIASASAIAATGATPVLVDCDEFHLIDPAAVSSAITTRTRAVLPVHLYGQPANFDALAEIAAQHRIEVVEDAAQAHGATLRDGRRCGALGRAAAFSFYPGKNLGAFGDGGGVTTNDPDLARRLAILRNWGAERKYHHDVPGFNRRLDTLQAAILDVKLRRLAAWNAARQQIAGWYRELLTGLPRLETPLEAPWCGRHVYHLFVVRLLEGDRDCLIQHLARAGIQAQIHYPIPIHRQKSFSHLGYLPGQFPRTEKFASTILSLPMFPEMERAQCEFVCEQIRKFLS